MRFIYSPAACSISAHIILQEIGAPFTAERIVTKQGGTRTNAFLSLNPKGKVPVLVLEDGRVITETPVLLQFLGRTYPGRGLLPADEEGEFEALQLCEYLSNTVHNFGLTRLFRPQFFCAHESSWSEIRQEGERVLGESFDLIAPRLGRKQFLFDHFSIADASLFFFELHARRLHIPMPVTLSAHLELMLDRPSVAKVLEREELDMGEFLPAA